MKEKAILGVRGGRGVSCWRDKRDGGDGVSVCGGGQAMVHFRGSKK